LKPLFLRFAIMAGFTFCGHPVCLGQAEKRARQGRKIPEGDTSAGGLIASVAEAAYDGSPEFEIALSLAGIYDASFKIGPLRSNLEPTKIGKNKNGNITAAWNECGREVGWNAADLCRNMTAVLERRFMDGERSGCDQLPISGRRTASLDAIAAFIAGETDDARIENSSGACY
jgi:CRISPR-associated protein Csx17